MKKISQKEKRIVIIGGGIIGSAIALELATNGYKNIQVIEKNKTIPGRNQSSTNGGIIHSGTFYPKDIEPMKAKLCVEGNKLMFEFCEKNRVPHKKTGKLIVATNAQEEEYIHFFYDVGVANRVPGIQKISGKKAKEYEPNLGNVTLAIYLPNVGSVAFNALMTTVKNLAEKKGVTFILGTKVIAITAKENEFSITTIKNKKKNIIYADILINAAGLYADEIAKMVNPTITYTIEPTRSELFAFDKSSRKDIYMNGLHIYQRPYCYFTDTRERAYVSAKELHRLLKEGKIAKAAGIHLSPAFDVIDGTYVLGNTIGVGPAKSLGYGKEDYTTNLKKADAYIKDVQHFFPNLKETDLHPRYAGIMAINKGHDDFIIKKDDQYSNCIQLIGLDSPAWTSTFAIATYVHALLSSY